MGPHFTLSLGFMLPSELVLSNLSTFNFNLKSKRLGRIIIISLSLSRQIILGSMQLSSLQIVQFFKVYEFM